MRVVTIVMLSSGIPILSCVPADIGSVGVREVGISCPLLSALLAGLCLQHMLHASVCFASCNCSDLSVLVARKSRIRTEILANTGTQIKKKQLLKNNATYFATFTVVIARNIHYRCFSWNSQLTFNGLTSRCSLTTPTKSHPHKFNYCNLLFAMLSALTKFTKVKFT